MKNLVNRNKTKWIRPWELEKFDNLYNRDERFFSIVIKGMLSWLNRNVVMYNKPIKHFILSTGSAYLYVESNGYEYKLSETTGEDMMYMEMPRCIVEIEDISFPQEEFSSPYSRGNYERIDGTNIRGFNAEIRRLPLEISFNLKYVFGTFNESIVVLQELIDKIIFQQYFNVVYLGQPIQCSIEFPGNTNPELNKIDMSSPEVNQKNLTLNVKICTNYPLINERSEILSSNVISSFGGFIELNVDYSNERYIDYRLYNSITNISNFLTIFCFNRKEYLTKEDILKIRSLIEYLASSQLTKDFIKSFIAMFDLNGDGIVSLYEISYIKKFIAIYDFNYDNIVNNDDMNELDFMFQLGTNSSDYDVNNDGIVNESDKEKVIELKENIDLDSKGYVVQADIDIIMNFFKSVGLIFFEKNEITQEDIDYIIGLIEFFEKEMLDKLDIIVFDAYVNFIMRKLDTLTQVSIQNALKILEIFNFLDLNKDGVIDDKDINILVNYINNGNYVEEFDFNHDGVIDEKDLEYMENTIEEYSDKNVREHKVTNEIIYHRSGGVNDESSITDTHKFIYNTFN